MTSLNNIISATINVSVFIAIFEIVIHMIDCSFINDFQTNSAKNFLELISLSRDTKVFDEAESINFYESAIFDTSKTKDISSIDINSTIDSTND